jgi:hypothetical protein
MLMTLAGFLGRVLRMEPPPVAAPADISPPWISTRSRTPTRP